MVIMHVFSFSFWLIHNFDNSLYYNPLTVNHLFIFIMSRVVDGNKPLLDLALMKWFHIHVLSRVWHVIKRPQVLASKVKFDFQLHDICILIVLCFFLFSKYMSTKSCHKREPEHGEPRQSYRHSRNLETSGWCILINVNISHM